MELAKAYNPQEAQTKWLAFWDERGYFHSKPDSRQPFTIVIPPPNVTGALHMGHALNNTLQDVLIRWRRMQATTPCGCLALITPASPPRPWWNGSSCTRKKRRATRLAARSW
jgi:hypothetical protein